MKAACHSQTDIANGIIVSNMKTIAITIDNDVIRRIDNVASNRSEFIRRAVDDYLSRMERAAEEEHERKIFKRNRSQLRRQAVALIKEQAKS
jgi:Arc/MetJ-type ribon-helix-helix transcriptional regulator